MASTVSQIIEDIRSFRPMDIKFIQRCINDFLDEKYHNGIPNHMNYGAHIERCPKCGSVHFVKNGFDYNHKQKYRCKDCNTVFSATTGTMFSNSPVSFDTWRTFITGELNGLTLQQQSAATRLSVTTCFHMRHKLYAAISIIQDQVVLEGNIELDPAYTKINLKGTKPENMPRLSKHRGKHKSVFSKDIRGISGHKICLVTAIDENDNIELVKMQSIDNVDIEDGNLDVYYKTTDNAYYLDSNMPIVINSNVKINDDANNIDYDNYSSVLTSIDPITYFKHICDNLRYNILYDAAANQYKIIIF